VKSKSCYEFFLKNNNNAKLQYTLAFYKDSDGKSGVFFFSAKFRQNVKNEREKICQNFFPLFCKKLSNFQPHKKKKKVSNILPTFGL
jgi:hypothetical protein